MHQVFVTISFDMPLNAKSEKNLPPQYEGTSSDGASSPGQKKKDPNADKSKAKKAAIKDKDAEKAKDNLLFVCEFVIVNRFLERLRAQGPEKGNSKEVN